METLHLRQARSRSIPIEQTRRPEHNEMSATSKTSPWKVAFAEQNGKPTHSGLGKADDTEEETGESTREPSGQGTRHLGKDLQR